MELIANALNGRFPVDLVTRADVDALTQIDLAVAYVTHMDAIFDLATRRDVPLTLFALADGHGFPQPEVARRFVHSKRTSWRLLLTRDFYHPKLMWFRGAGAYIGSANLTDKAWVRNVECGIWIPEDELQESNWADELASIIAEMEPRFREATDEDLDALSRLRDRRRGLDQAESEFRAEIERFLGHLPGNKPAVHVASAKEARSAAALRFAAEWDNGLTILRKIAQVFDENRSRWPSWVERTAEPTIVQDQATDWWWDREFRHSGESRVLMVDANRKNSSNPDIAVRTLLDDWCSSDPGAKLDSRSAWVNEHPRELRELLATRELAKLDEERLTRILYLSHAAREHARQIRKPELGLAPDDTRGVEERAKLYAKFLLSQRTSTGLGIGDVLQFVLWSEGGGARLSVADRIWRATRDPERRLRHLGTAILGELVGYARPTTYPPRNNRVSKTLFALGFGGVTYS